MILLWICFIVGGFLLGSILFSKIIPNFLLGKNICELGSDGNPGAANVFMNCGKGLGAICLLADILKGVSPVCLALIFLDRNSFLFTLVMISPVLGHALGVFNRFHGGKCISTSFGVLIGLLPTTRVGFLLAAVYVLFSTIIKINPNSRRSIISFAIFGVGSVIILFIRNMYPVALGCAAISLIAILKHLHRFEHKEEIMQKEFTYSE